MNEELILQIIIASTRPGRVGPAVARWVEQEAQAHGKFAVELVDLADFHLPLLEESKHPRHGQYDHAATQRWSESVQRADAYVFVLPEYDFSMPATLLNAMQVLYHEWTYKPAAIASYGGESGGLRSTQMTKQVATTFKLVPMVEAVTIPYIARHIDKTTGAFTPDEGHPKKAQAMFDELHRWALALKGMRVPAATIG